MTVVLDPVLTDAPDLFEPLVHWCEPPYTHGICGRKLTDNEDADQAVNCVVCLDLAGRR